MTNAQVLAKKIIDLVSELETYNFYKQDLQRRLKRLFTQYQKGEFEYFEYEKRQRKLLKGKTEDEMLQYYDQYMLSLLTRIKTYNSEIFYEAYQDKRYKGIHVVEPVVEKEPLVAPEVPVKKVKKAPKIKHKVKPAPNSSRGAASPTNPSY
ncbi:hypothetical protein ACFL0V_04185, partial [Nanoarchaeota archaeon]